MTLSDFRLRGHGLAPSSNETSLSTLGTHHYPTGGDLRVSGSLPHRVRRCGNSQLRARLGDRCRNVLRTLDGEGTTLDGEGTTLMDRRMVQR